MMMTSSFMSMMTAPFVCYRCMVAACLLSALKHQLSTSVNYCWNVIADRVGQRRVEVVVLNVVPPPRKLQHSPSVEQSQISTVTRLRSVFNFARSGLDVSKGIGLFGPSCGVKTFVDSPAENTRPLMSLSSPG